MRTAFIVAVVMASPVVAADFRGTAFGESCASIQDRESSLGSTLKEQKQTKADTHIVSWLEFAGNAFHQEVEVTYLCSDGLLNSGGYLFKESNYDKALNEFVAVYAELIATLGPPINQAEDGKDISASMDLSTLEMPEPITYSASWAIADFYPNLSLMVNGSYEGAGWHVVYTFSREH